MTIKDFKEYNGLLYAHIRKPTYTIGDYSEVIIQKQGMFEVMFTDGYKYRGYELYNTIEECIEYINKVIGQSIEHKFIVE